MSKKGFCKFHGPDRQQGPDAPSELTCCAEVILPNLIYRLLQFFRSYFEDGKFYTDCESHLKLLNEFSSLGTPLRKILVKYMLCSDFYTKKIQQENQVEKSYSHKSFQKLLVDFNKDLRVADELKAKLVKPNFSNILNECVYWCIRRRFPESLVNFLLNLLPEFDFKIEFSRSFINHYTFISSECILDHTLLNISMISAQLFSNLAIVKKAYEEFNLFEVFISALYNVLNAPNVLKVSPIHDNDNLGLASRHYVVDVENILIQERIYWQTLRDLIYSLTHKPIALKFLEDSTLFSLWIQCLLCLEAMNLNVREIYSHIEDAQSTYLNSLEAENDFFSVNWLFMTHLNDESTVKITSNCIRIIERLLLDWLTTIGLRNGKTIIRPNPNQLTFHLPVNRLYSVFLYFILFKQKEKLSNVLVLNDNDLMALVGIPLQTLIGFYEIQSNMWVLNGLEMKQQALIYLKIYFNEPDLFLLQLVLSKFNDSELFMKVLIDRFHLLRYSQIKKNNESDENGVLKIENKYDFMSLDLKKKHSMFTSLLTFLAQLICIKPYLDPENRNSIRKEIVTILSSKDRVYSEIEEVLPRFGDLGFGETKNEVEEVVKLVADFKQPSFKLHTKDLKEGYYVPKDYLWIDEYDPLHVSLRYGELESSANPFERYEEFIKNKNLNKDMIGNLWEPFRLPKFETLNSIDFEFLLLKMRILETKALHSLLFNWLYKHYYEQQLPEKSMALIIFILELALYKVC